MDGIGHRLATEKGMSQEHYATIQCSIANHIERLTKKLEYNRKWYVSFLKCNKVFFKDILIDGVCRKCTYSKNEEKKIHSHLGMRVKRAYDCEIEEVEGVEGVDVCIAIAEDLLS